MTATTLEKKNTFYKMQGDELFIINPVSGSAYELALLLLKQFNFTTKHGIEHVFSMEDFALKRKFSKSIRTLRTACKKLQVIGFLVKTKLGWIINPRGKISPDDFVYRKLEFTDDRLVPQTEAEVPVKNPVVSTMGVTETLVETVTEADISNVHTQAIAQTPTVEASEPVQTASEKVETMQSISEEPVSFNKDERIDQLRRYGKLMAKVNPEAAESWNGHIERGLESKTIYSECSLLIMNFFVKSCCMGEDYDTIPDWLKTTGMSLSLALREFGDRRTSYDDIRQRTSSNCANVYRVYNYREILCMKTFKTIPHRDSQPWQVPFGIQDFDIVEKNPYLQ